jgi:phage shock protein PspC (stress-responsive transcriptional regulator)
MLGNPGGMSEHTVEGPAVRRLERSRDDRMLAGVCGGLARYFGIHPAFYRVGFVVLTLIGGAGILVYLAAVLVMPDEGRADSIAAETLRDSRDHPWPLIGLGLLALAGVVLLSRVTLWPRGDAAWILLLLAGGAILFLARRNSPAPPAAEPPEASAGEATAAGAAPAAATPAKTGGHVGRTIMIVFGSFVALVLVTAAIFVAIFPMHLSHGVGHKSFTPTSTAALEQTYRLGIGELDLDLTQLSLPVGETRVKARVDYGDVEVVVPSDVAVRAYGRARLGYVNVLGDEDDGRNADERARATGRRVLVIDARAQVGAVWIRTARTMRPHVAPRLRPPR